MTPTPKPDCAHRSLSDLHHDRRGAVIVMALFMSIFLVGCLWYLIGIGDAAVYRARVDAGADAVAYTAAVFHARGMNMIAMLNLIIAASVALIVVAKTLSYIIGIVYYAASWMCTSTAPELPPGACDVAKEASNRYERLTAILKQLEGEEGYKLLASLSKAQREIAELTPWVASTESTAVATGYKPMTSGLAVSPSMMPTMPRLGLPVMDEPYPVTCSRGGAIGPEMVKQLIPKAYEPILEEAGQSVDALIAGFPTEYCGDTHYTGQKLQLFNEKDICDDRQKKEDEKKNNGGGQNGGGQNGGGQNGGGQNGGGQNGGGQNGGQGGGFNHDDCVKEEGLTPEQIAKKKEEKGIDKVNPEESLDQIPEPELKSAKMMISQARNGTDYFQVYSMVQADTSMLHKTDKGVLIAAGSKEVALEAAKFEGWGYSQAEFYYDQTDDATGKDRCWNQGNAGSGCNLNWDAYKDNVLWNLRWRARLRLVRLPAPGENGQNVDVDVLGADFPSSSGASVDSSDYVPSETLDDFQEPISNGIFGEALRWKNRVSGIDFDKEDGEAP